MSYISDLLDTWFEKTGCEYMSDMKQPAWRDKVCETASGMDAEAFRLEQWSEAVTYLWGETVVFSSYDELRAYFKKDS